MRKRQKSSLAKALYWNTPHKERYGQRSEGKRVRMLISVLSVVVFVIAMSGLVREFF